MATRWTPEAEYRVHPAYELALEDALAVVQAHALAGLSIEHAEAARMLLGDEGVAGEIRGMIADYETRRRGGRT